MSIRTVSMLTEAASLEPMLARLAAGDADLSSAGCYLPSVVVIAIDVEDLVTLDTQDTDGNKHSKETNSSFGRVISATYPDKTHSVKPGKYGQLLWHCAMAG